MGTLIVATVVGTVIAMVILAVLGIVLKEVVGHITKLPSVVIRLAVARLPENLREEYAAEWGAEMLAIQQKFKATPITRAIRVARYTISLLPAGRSVGREFRKVGAERPAGKIARFTAVTKRILQNVRARRGEDGFSDAFGEMLRAEAERRALRRAARAVPSDSYSDTYSDGY